MEVKIKTKDFLVDATIEMVDGVMLVSPVADVDLKPKKWKPGLEETFYYVNCYEDFHSDVIFFVDEYVHYDKGRLEADRDIKIGNCFKTEEEAQKYCDRLNEEVRKVKEEML